MNQDRNIDDLRPSLQPIARAFVNMSTSAIAPSKCAIIVTYRDAAAQDVAHAAGLSKASAGSSPHNVVDSFGRPASCAFDWAVFDQNGAYVSDGTDHRYATAGGVAVGLGLVWGGDWRPETDGCQPDYDHAEMKDWKQYILPSSAALSGTA